MYCIPEPAIIYPSAAIATTTVGKWSKAEYVAYDERNWKAVDREHQPILNAA
jgi:hypothetical protein